MLGRLRLAITYSCDAVKWLQRMEDMYEEFDWGQRRMPAWASASASNMWRNPYNSFCLLTAPLSIVTPNMWRNLHAIRKGETTRNPKRTPVDSMTSTQALVYGGVM
jgi:hypothetical protein